MGRIDPAPSPSGRGAGARAKVLVGIAAALAIAIGSYWLGRSDSVPPPSAAPSRKTDAPVATVPPLQAAATAKPVAQSTDELLAAFERARPSPPLDRSETEVTMARPDNATATQPPRPEVTDPPETPRARMVRCLTFRVENDDVHYAGYSPVLVPLKVTASNACSFSFEGPDVSVEVRAIPLHGEGTIVRAVGQFQDPILPRGTSETQVVLACPRCYEIGHRFEVSIP